MGKESNVKLNLDLNTQPASEQYQRFKAFCEKHKFKVNVDTSKVSQSLLGVRQLVTDISNSSSKIGDGFSGAASSIKGIVGPVAAIQLAFAAIAGIFKSLMDSSRSFRETVQSLFIGISAGVKSVVTNFDSLKSVLVEVGDIVVTAVLTPFKATFDAITKIIEGDFKGAWQEFKNTLKQGAEAVSNSSDVIKYELESNVELYKANKEAAEALYFAQKRGEDVAIGFAAQEARLKESIAETTAVIKDEFTSLETKQKAIEQLKTSTREYKAGIEALRKAQKDERNALLDTITVGAGLGKFNDELRKFIYHTLAMADGIDRLKGSGGVLAAFADALSTDAYKKINDLTVSVSNLGKEVTKIEEETKKTIGSASLEAEVKIKIPEGSIADIKLQISALENQLEFTIFGSDEYKATLDRINELKAKITEAKKEIANDTSLRGSIIKLLDEEEVLNAKEQIAGFYEWLQDEYAANEIRLFSEEEFADLQEYYNLVTNIKKQQAKLAEDNLKVYNETTKAIDGTGRVFNSLGLMVSAVGDESRDAAIAVQALAIAEQIAAMASAIHTAALGDPYTVAARIIAAAAAVTASIVSIQSLSKQNFAQGGIVQGQFQSGDRQLVGVNAGEMILTKQQQGNLFNLLDGANSRGGSEVEFKIKGADLVGVLDNYNTFNNRGL